MSNLQKASQNTPAHATKTNKPEAKAKAPAANAAQVLSSPETALPGEVLAAQQQVGNQVVQRALDPGKRGSPVTDEKGNLHSDLTKEINQKRGGGSPLPDSIGKEVSKKFGRSFNEVRLHTDDKADKLSRTISARAFTIGSDIFFKSGVFNPASTQGRETLIHELTHVVQQAKGSKGGSGSLKLGAPDTAMEKEAEKMGKRHASAKAASSPSAAPGPAVQREMSNNGLPDQLKSGVENLSGMSMDNVKVHANSPKPAQLNARAYTQGSDLHLGGGQEQHLPHEAWHVVQQKQGRVDPTLQMQPDHGGMVQREAAPEEEELQAQPDAAGMIQRVEEEETLQAQPDVHGLIQREDDDWDTSDNAPKEEHHIPSREEMNKLSAKMVSHMRDPRKNERQARKFNLAEIDKIPTPQEPVIPKAPPMAPKTQKQEEIESMTRAFQTHGPKKDTGPAPKSLTLAEQLNAKKENLKHTKGQGLKDIEKTRTEKFTEMHKYTDEGGDGGKTLKGNSQAEKISSSRGKLMSTIQDPKSSAEEVKAAKEQLDMMHKRSKTDRLKSFFTKGGTTASYSEQAEKARYKNLKNQAKTGDKDAFEKFKAAKTEKKANATSTQVLGGLKKVGGAALNFLKDRGHVAADHRLGKKKEAEPEEEKGKGGGGNGGALEMITQLHKENQSLKAELTKLKEAKPVV